MKNSDFLTPEQMLDFCIQILEFAIQKSVMDLTFLKNLKEDSHTVKNLSQTHLTEMQNIIREYGGTIH